MRRVLAFSFCFALILQSLACGPAPSQGPAAGSGASGQDPLKRGEYLVSVLGCNDCHTPKVMGPEGPEPDKTRMLSGHSESLNLPAPPVLPPGPWMATTNTDLTAWSGPWGISYATNLTPDQDTGMGIWTEDMFIKAIRTGKHMSSGRPILPPMPWTDFRNLTDEDLKAVFAFLRSLPPIKNHVPDAVIAPPPPQTPPAA